MINCIINGSVWPGWVVKMRVQYYRPTYKIFVRCTLYIVHCTIAK